MEIYFYPHTSYDEPPELWFCACPECMAPSHMIGEFFVDGRHFYGQWCAVHWALWFAHHTTVSLEANVLAQLHKDFPKHEHEEGHE